MSEPRLPAEATPASPNPSDPSVPVAAEEEPPRRSRRAPYAAALLIGALALAALAVAWRAQERVHTLEQELVRRQTESAGQATEAQLIAKQARDGAHDAAAKVALLDARVAESALQSSQLEGLLQSLARSREESLVADLETGLRLAVQHSAITGSAEPLTTALAAADERLARAEHPSLENVRRAIARDLGRIRSVGMADVASLAIKLDEGVRLIDEAPLRVIDAPGTAAARAALLGATSPAAAPSPAEPAPGAWDRLAAGAGAWWHNVWSEARGLVRVARIDRPEAMLLAPEQSFFLRENLKLKLLNARLALQSRQFDAAQADLQAAAAATERYFDGGSRKTTLLAELLASVAGQARQAGLPRPDDTLAALDAAQGR